MSGTVDQRRKRMARYGPESAGLRRTPAQYDAIPEGAFTPAYRYELIDGVLVVTPPPGIGERDPNDLLGYWLRGYQEQHPEGHHLDLTVPEPMIAVGENRRRCDRAIWAGLGRQPDVGLEGDVPAIVVEFVSARRRDEQRDYEQKRDEYLSAGVREYWVIDRFRKQMSVYRRGATGEVSEQVVREPQRYSTALLPGLDVPLARLLAAGTRWGARARGQPKVQLTEDKQTQPPSMPEASETGAE